MLRKIKQLSRQIRILKGKYFCFMVNSPAEEEQYLKDMAADYPNEETLCVFIKKYDWD